MGGLLGSLTDLITSGVTWAINKVVETGAFFYACMAIVVSWITTTLVAIVLGLVEQALGTLPSLAGVFADLGLWLFMLFAFPYLAGYWSVIWVRFVIRRLPVIG